MRRRPAGLLPALAAALLAAAVPAAAARAQAGRDHVGVVADPTLYGLVVAAVEAFGPGTRFKYPAIETADAAAGFALFCAGKSLDQPDIVLSLRPIAAAERLRCVDNDVGELAELRPGFIALALVEARSAAPLAPTPRELFLAAAEQVPDPAGRATAAADPLATPLVPNPYARWSELAPGLPDRPIRLLLGPPGTAARGLLDELVLRPGCRELPAVAALEPVDPTRFRRVCGTVRRDAALDERRRGEAELVAALAAAPPALAVTRLDVARRHGHVLRAVPLGGVAPSPASVQDGTYPAARPIHLYVKRRNFALVPGLREFLAEIVGEKASGPDGYLVAAGLVPLAPEAQAGARHLARDLAEAEPEARPAAGAALEAARAAEEAREKEAARAAAAEKAQADAAARAARAERAAADAAERARRVEAARAAEVEAAARAERAALERRLWETAAAQGEPALLRGYLALFPQGAFAAEARSRLAARAAPPDGDGDGVEDTGDACPGTPAGAPVDPAGCWSPPVLRFGPDQAALDTDQRAALAGLIEVLRRNPELRLVAEGHSDGTGSPEGNRGVALARARAVAAHLAAAGIDPHRLAARGFGADRPLAPNEDTAGRARNRRVELRLEPVAPAR